MRKERVGERMAGGGRRAWKSQESITKGDTRREDEEGERMEGGVQDTERVKRGGKTSRGRGWREEGRGLLENGDEGRVWGGFVPTYL